VSPELSLSMVGAVAALALSTGLSASLPSLWLVLRGHAGARATPGATLVGRQWLPLLPPVFQVALTVALVAAVATLALTMSRLAAVDLGFDAADVEVLSLTVPPSTNQPDQSRVFGELIRRVSLFPNVTAVGATSLLPLSGEDAIALLVDVKGIRPIRGGFKERFALTFAVKGAFLDAMGIRVVSGKGLSGGIDGTPQEALINLAFSRRYGDSEQLLGRELVLPGGAAAPRIVGIIDDVRFLGLQKDVGPQVILPADHNPGVLTSLVIRSTRRDPHLPATIRETLHELHPTVVAHDGRDMTARLGAVLEPQRRALIGAAAAAGLFGILGVTGLVSNLLNYVYRTRRSIGIRLALGATKTHVARIVLSRAAVLVGTGAALGCALGTLGLQYLAHHQQGLIMPGPAGYVVATCAATLVGLASGWPATRAALRIEPSSLLREDLYR